MSAKFKTEHYEMVLKLVTWTLPAKAFFSLGGTEVGQSYPNFYVSQLASKFVKVVLSGAGGDKLSEGIPGGTTGRSKARI